MAWQLYRLRPTGGAGFHFGRQGHGIETSSESWPSDSLFSALVSLYAELFNDTDAFLEPWRAGEPPFLVSSLFPYIGSLNLLPMPRVRINLGEDMRAGAGKALKKLSYISPRIAAGLLQGAAMDAEWVRAEDGLKSGPRASVQHGRVWLAEDERAALPPLPDEIGWHTGPVPRVAVDRISQESQVYQAGRTVFAPECGLWFAAQVQDQGDILDLLLEELSLRGIGGERSAGYGAFTLERADAGQTLPQDTAGASLLLTLARYNPRQDEVAAGVLAEGAAYDLVKVGGWLASPGIAAQRRRWAHFIEAGSVVRDVGAGTLGRLVDVTPQYDNPAGAPPHPIYRNGYALTIGVAGEGAT